MEKKYLSKEQQERLVRKRPEKICDIPERTRGTYFVLYDWSVVLKNPCEGDTQEVSNYIYERKSFLRETGGK